MKKRTYGLELEKPVADKATGQPHFMSQNHFKRLADEAEKRGANPHFHYSDVKTDVILGMICDDLGEQGVDNGFNLQETSLPYTTDLHALFEKVKLDVKLIQDSFQQEDATIINISNHPLAKTDQESYVKYVAPKSIYPYMNHRGWDHSAGINANAQNSPATGVDAIDAADAVSVVIGIGAALIGIFGNSPYAEGKRSQFKESRCGMWNRMFGNSITKGDLRCAQFPKFRFETMSQYFNWMFGGDSGIHFAIIGGDGKDYKSLGDSVVMVEGNPPVLEYLAKPSWKAYFLKDLNNGDKSHPTQVKPEISHMETMQFTIFAGGRIRYGLKKDTFPVEAFLEACKKQNEKEVEKIFAEHAAYTYIEGRDAGANFPDQEMMAENADVVRSMVMAPSAIQAGLLQNLPEAVKLIEKYDWSKLGQLRNEAIKDGLQGKVDDLNVRSFAEEVLTVAEQGLQLSEHWMLAYPKWVLKTGKNGADRAIEFVEAQNTDLQTGIVKLIQSRAVTLAPYED